jgi:hypothetical protein
VLTLNVIDFYIQIRGGGDRRNASPLPARTSNTKQVVGDSQSNSISAHSASRRCVHFYVRLAVYSVLHTYVSSTDNAGMDAETNVLPKSLSRSGSELKVRAYLSCKPWHICSRVSSQCRSGNSAVPRQAFLYMNMFFISDKNFRAQIRQLITS